MLPVLLIGSPLKRSLPRLPKCHQPAGQTPCSDPGSLQHQANHFKDKIIKTGFSNLVVLRLTDLVDLVDFRFREAEVKVTLKIITISNVFEHLITTNPQMAQ
jgi:hypothetical protein